MKAVNLVLEQGIQKLLYEGAVPLPQLEVTMSTRRALIVEGLWRSLFNVRELDACKLGDKFA